MAIRTDSVIRQGPAAAEQIEPSVGFAASSTFVLMNGKIVVTVAGNALTIAVKTLSDDDPSSTNPVFCGFRSQSGTYIVRAITAALSLIIPDGATLETESGTGYRVWWVLFDVAGSVRLAAKNCSTSTTIFPLSEYGFASATAIGAGSDSAGVFYANDDITTNAFRIVGFSDWESGQAVAGTWATDADITFLFGPGTKTPGDVVQRLVDPRSDYFVFSGLMGGITVAQEITDGDEIFSELFSPTSQINFIEIELVLWISGAGGSTFVCALFFDGATDAVSASAASADKGAGIIGFHYLFYKQRIGATLASSISARGGSTSGSFEVRLNRTSSPAVLLGGKLQSSIRITELMG